MKTPEDFTNPKKPWEIEGIEWREVKLGEACIINPKKSEVKHLLNQNVEVSFIPMKYVDETQGKIVKMDTKPLQAVYKGYTYFKEGDVLFAKITPCMENGKSAIAHDLRNNIGFGSTEFHVLRPKENIASEFVFYFIRRKRFRNLAKLHFTGTVGHKRVPKEFLISAKISIPFRNDKPDLETQKKIVEYIEANFSRIDEILEKKKKELEQLDELLESVLEHAFKPKEGEEWREVRLGEVAHIIRGVNFNKGEIVTMNQGEAVITASHIQGDHLIKEDLIFVPSTKVKAKQRVRSGDIIIVMSTGSRRALGRTYYSQADEDVHIGAFLGVIRCNRAQQSPKFIYHFTKTQKFKAHLFNYTGSQINNVSISKIKNLKIPLPFRNNQPNIEKQKEIASYLDSVYEKIKALKEMVH